MKLLFTFLPVLSLFSVSQAQDFAEDWTQTDCSGTEHTLFTELDAGLVVIMEFVMPTGCVPCITAAENIGPLVDELNAAYDNRVQYYTFGYNDGYTCELLDSWAEDYSLTPTAKFNAGTDILAYYGSMGMPTIVIVGGSDHAVHYEKMGFSVSNMDDIEEAILEGLGIEDTSTIAIVNSDISSILMYPNPATEIVSISFNDNVSIENFSLLDLKGMKITGLSAPALSGLGNTQTVSFNISSIPNGIYLIQLTGNGFSYIEKLVVNH